LRLHLTSGLEVHRHACGTGNYGKQHQLLEQVGHSPAGASSITAAAFAAILLIAEKSGGFPAPGRATEPTPGSRAVFAPDGSVQLPNGYRAWVHIGTRIKVGGKNILDGKDLTTPQVLDAYVEPTAYAAYQKTGKWPDGTQLVKEISEIKTGQGCDPTTYLCTTPLGTGIFQEKYTGIGMMVKDTKRYPSDPGNWGYFAFFRHGQAYDRTAALRSQDKCSLCHVRFASYTDFVIVQSHLALAPGNLQ
jgi:hypothetical protein